MLATNLPGIGAIDDAYRSDFLDLEVGGNGLWQVGKDGVQRILTPLDKKVDFIVYEDKTLAFVKSAMGYPAIYQVPDVSYEGPADAVLMDLDGTSVYSEPFWIWVIEQVTARLLDNPKFELEHCDEPFVSGHSVSEHLQYCITKYCPEKNVEEARVLYFEKDSSKMLAELQSSAALRGRQAHP